MRRRVTTHFRLSMLLALSVAGASTASAQIGKLKKMGADAVKDAVGKKAADPTAARVDYAITKERLESIITVLAPLAAGAQREADARAANERRAAEAKALSTAYDEKVKVANECATKATAGRAPDLASVDVAKYEAVLAKSTTVSVRLAEAQAAKRWRQYIALTDTFLNVQMQTALMMFPNKCPVYPYKPTALIEAEVAKMEQATSSSSTSTSSSSTSSSGTSDELTIPSASRGGMTTGQFGRIRERMAIWALIEAGDLPPASDKFTDEEKAVLAARVAEIKKLGPLFKAGTMRWATWGDIKSW